MARRLPAPLAWGIINVRDIQKRCFMQFSVSKSRDIFSFILIAFGFSWAFWIPQAAIAQGWDAPNWVQSVLAGPWNIAAFGPTIAAFVMVWRRGSLLGLAQFIWKGLTQSFRPWLLIPALFLFPAVTGAAIWLAYGWDELSAASPLFTGAGAIPGVAMTILLTGGPVQEEFGWRGYLLGRVQSRFSGLLSATLIGLVWAIWHFPLNFTDGTNGPQYSEAIPIFVGSIITLTLVSILIGWIYNASRGSVLLAILMHGSLNVSTFYLFPVFNFPDALPIYTGGIFLAAVVVTIVAGPRRLGR